MLHTINGDIMQKSVWYEGVKLNKNKALTKDIKTDILIIGGGITGISIAYHLKDCPYKITLVEKDTCGCSTTSKSTGKLTFMQGNIYNKISNIYNQDIAIKYLKSQQDTIKIIKQIIEDNNINCDLESIKSIIFTTNKVNELKKEYNLLKQSEDIHVSSFKDFNSKYATEADNTYIINPLKYVNELKKILLETNINIYEDTQIIKCVKKDNHYICYTPNNSIKTKIVILANHYPWFINPFFLPLKNYKEKSTLVAYKPNNNKDVTAINIDKETISFRPYKDYLIYLSDTHKICDNDSMNIDTFKHNLSTSNIDYIWSNHDLITFDYMPFIGLIDNNLYLATGYNTWGLTNGSLAGKIISDLILNNENEYESLFNPKRPLNLLTLKNTIFNIGCNIKAYIKPKHNLINYQAKNKCPHMKCGLIYNKNDNTWDCPCHGSRFDKNGKCFLGPSTKDITINKEK